MESRVPSSQKLLQELLLCIGTQQNMRLSPSAQATTRWEKFLYVLSRRAQDNNNIVGVGQLIIEKSK